MTAATRAGVEMAALAGQVTAVHREVAALRQEVGHLRDEVGFEGALLRQDVANKILSLVRTLATRHELIQLVRKVHRQLLGLRSDLQEPRPGVGALALAGAPVAAGPATPEWFEIRAMDSAPLPWERPPRRKGKSEERHDTAVSPAPGGQERSRHATVSPAPGGRERSRHTLVLEDPRPRARPRAAPAIRS